MKWLGLLLANLMGNGIARMLTGAGLAVVSYAALAPLLLGALNLAASYFEGIVGAGFQLVMMSGVGHAVSMIGSAIMTRAAINAASASVSIGKAASA